MHLVRFGLAHEMINTGASRDNGLTAALHRRTFETGEVRFRLTLFFDLRPVSADLTSSR
jgi:hypothetical protein